MVFVWWNSEYVYYALAVMGVVVNAVLTIAHVAAILYAIFRLNKKPPKLSTEEGKDHPGVSILKRCKGVDANLEENLETYFHLDYPKYEILFARCCYRSDGAPH